MLPVSSAFLLQSDNSLLEDALRWVEGTWRGFSQYFVGEDLWIQCGVLAGVFILAYLVSLGLSPLYKRMTPAAGEAAGWVGGAGRWVRENSFRILLALLLWSVSLYFDRQHAAAETVEAALDLTPSERLLLEVGAAERGAGQSVGEAETAGARKNYILLRAVASVATLWLVSAALPRAIRQQVYFRTLFFVLAIGLMLNLLGVWETLRDGLNSLKLFPISESRETQVTALTILKGLIAVFLIIPLSGWVLRAVESRVAGMEQVSPALRALVVKVVRTVVVIAVGLFAISSIGFNLGALAILGGAVGLGLGFGLQKVVSNLVSGVILLADRSIKPGDVIEVDDTYGWINRLGARYASVVTRDGTEHLIPNETLITEKVTNWSFSDENVRIKIPFGISYQSDIHLAMKLSLQVVEANARVLKKPAPAVRLMGFGDNSVDFELRIWMSDPAMGVNNLRSDVYVAIWDLFKEHGVEFPFPQRDLHVRDSVPLEVVLRKREERGGEL